MAKKILIIEDDSFLQGLASTKLEKDGFEVHAASSGEEAFKHLATDTPEIILCDLVLPEMDGFTIIKNIRADAKTATTPIIVFSNLSEEKDVKQAKDNGATEFMVKSNFTLDELSDKIKEILK